MGALSPVNQRGREGWLVSWYTESSQPQRIISGLKTNFNLSPSYSTHKSSSHKFSEINKINPDTNLYETEHAYTNVKHNILEGGKEGERERKRENCLTSTCKVKHQTIHHKITYLKSYSSSGYVGGEEAEGEMGNIIFIST